MQTPITRVILDNGLEILLKEIHTAPVISQWVWYRVGSRNEVPGLTGLSHWVEHMQFKGTPKFPSGVLDKVISRMGGGWNAATFYDWTAYYEMMPADKIDIALELEADRMMNSLFEEEEVESERTVIISELEGNENNPFFRLMQEMHEVSFDTHPYKNEVLGSKADLRVITRENLVDHYQSYYHPANAVISIAGNFDTAEMVDKLRNLYEHIPGRETPTTNLKHAPKFTKEKNIISTGNEDVIFQLLSYRPPASTHEDFYGLLILDSLLTGASGLNMFGGGISNKTSRLYRGLVETQKAIAINGMVATTIDPYLYNIYAVIQPEGDYESVLHEIGVEIKRIQDTPPSQEAIDRAVKQAKALFIYGSESISNQAFWMGYSEMFASYDWYLGYIDAIAKVTPQDVQRIARLYLQPQNRVVGTYLPESKGGETK